MGFVIIYLGKAKGVCIAWLPFFFPETHKLKINQNKSFMSVTVCALTLG